MIRKSHFIAALLLGACASPPKASPVAVVESLYSSTLVSPAMGLPTKGQAAHLAPFLDDSLDRLIARAQVIRDSEMVTHIGDKPSWADGDLFTSLFEGPTSFYAMTPIMGKVVKVPVRFERNDGGRSTIWIDTAIVIPRDTSWVIGDIIFGGTWPMAAKGTLKERLQP